MERTQVGDWRCNMAVTNLTPFLETVRAIRRDRLVETYRLDSLVVDTARQIVSERMTAVAGNARYDDEPLSAEGA